MSQRPNVLLLVCDTLRADFVGCCTESNRASATPNLDRFAKKGIVFSSAFAQGHRTPMSMPTLFTGKYPHKLKLAAIESPFGLRRKYRCLVMGKEKSIAEILAEQGYQTAGIHSNPLLTSDFGYQKGFQYFYDDLFLKDIQLPSSVKRWILRLPHLFRIYPYLSAEKLNRKAFDWLAKAREPFFLWLQYMDAHGPYTSKTGLRYVNKVRSALLFDKAVHRSKAITDKECQTLRDWYKEEVAYLDDQLGRLFVHLEKIGKLDNTLVVLTADHGEEFREHGRLTHHSTLYDEVLHVPLIFKLPHSRHGGTTVSKPVGLIQVLPTLLDILGIDIELRLDEKSLFPFIERNDERSLCKFIMSQGKFSPKIKAAARSEKWKFIFDESKAKGELYDLESDSRERFNIIDQNPEIAAELAALLREHLAVADGLDGTAESSKEEVDPEVLIRLRELGYL